MKYKIFTLILVLWLLCGCAMSVGKGQFVEYEGHQLLSEQLARSLSRDERLTQITANMKTVGFKRTQVSYMFDAFSNSVLSIYQNQYKLIKAHKTLLDNHKDVMSFLMANKGKSKKELAQAIKDFDSTAESEQQKIEPKLNAYEKASDKIWQENAKLSLEIAAQALQLGSVIYNATRGDRKIEEFIAVDLFSMLLSADKLGDSYKLAEIRLHLAKIANDFIKDEQAIIDISKQLQNYQDNK